MTLSNKHKAREYYENCKRLIKSRLADGTLSFSTDGQVVRSELYQAINASRAVMSQNHRVKRLLKATERLAQMKRLTSSVTYKKSESFERASGNGDPRVTQMQTRINHLEKQVAALTVENRELKKAVRRSDWIDKFLSDTEGTQGALPW